MKQVEAAPDRTLPPRFRIDDLVVDLGQASVSRNGGRIPLPGLSFDLLVVLAKAAPDLVTHDDLMRRVWQGVVVSPETVAQRVKLLRDALGDDPREPRYVAGVRGRGYRLLHSVVPASVDTPAGPEPGAGTDADERSAAAAPAASGSESMAVRIEEAATVGDREPARRAHDAERDATRAAGSAALGGPSRRPRATWGVAAVALAGLAVAVAWHAGLFGREAAAPPPPREASVDVVGLAPRTIAVLPFQNLSPDEANDYIGLGIAETVLNRLATTESLFVVARSSSFAFEDRNLDAREIGRRLGVRYLVQGGVQRDGERVRITAQVVDASTGGQLRAISLDRELRALFDVQDEVAAQVASALDATLDARAAGTTAVDAYLEYLQGLAALGRWRAPEFESAIAHFQAAQRLDPTYAAPYAGEAIARQRYGFVTRGEMNPQDPAIGRLVERALELDPQLAVAYVARARLQREPGAAESDLRRAVALAPSEAEGYFDLAQTLSNDPARAAEADALFDRAFALDPLQPRIRYVRALQAFARDGDEAKFEARMLDVLRIDPDYTQALNRLGNLYGFSKGRPVDALAMLERARAADPKSLPARVAIMDLYLSIGAVDLAEAAVADSPFAEDAAVPIALRRNDSRAAAEFALRRLAATDDRDGVAARRATPSIVAMLAFVTVLRDEAFRTGDHRRFAALLRRHYCPPPGDSSDCVQMRSIMAGTVLVELDYARDPVRGRAEAERAIRFLDVQMRGNWPVATLMRARLNAMLDRGDDAIADLQRAMRSQRLMGWWVFIHHDGVFDALQEDPRFRALRDEMDARASAQLAEYRRQRASRAPAPAARVADR